MSRIRLGMIGGGEGAFIGAVHRIAARLDDRYDFVGIFSKLAAIGYGSWAVLEWECCLKNAEDGAREGAEFIKHHIIRVTDRAFDDFAGAGTDDLANRKMLGLA